ncbi:MAG TPA: hypothetical protein VG204_01040 [Terriglobia bacterium]|nr:hypothetical protein [Terriglobia bacterium]
MAGKLASAARAVAILGLIVLCLTPARTSAAAEHALTKDDVSLLLIGGASTDKMVALIQQRGIDFQMNADLAQKFHNDGASDQVIDALQKAGEKWAAAQKNAGSSKEVASPARPVASGPLALPAPPAASSAPAASPSTSQPVNEMGTAAPVNTKIHDALAAADRTDKASENPKVMAAAGRPAAGPAPDLSDPSPDRTQQIIQEFAAKETLFKQARDNYTYHQINKIETLDPDGNPDGVYQQEWDILYDDAGHRIEHVTYAPVSTLQRVIMTPEDLNAMRNIQPFVLTSDELPEYEIKYLGHVKVDQITAYVFSIRPRELKKGHQYFQGVVWVDDRDLQIVKTEGKPVGELVKSKHGENLFPRFTTYREQIDGKFWFPTFTMADDTLHFSEGPPVHIKEVIRYSDYKQFKSNVKIIGVAPTDQPNPPKPPNQK